MNRAKYAILIFLFVFQITLNAQNQGAHNSAMGLLGVANNNLFSANVNPALLSQLDSTQIGLTLQKTGFAGRALEAGLQSKFAVKNVAMGLGINNFGNAYFNFSQLNYGLSKVLDQRQSIGMGVQYFSQYNYVQHRSNALAVNAGYYLAIKPTIKMGVALQRIAYTSSKELLNAQSALDNKATLGLEITAQKELSFYPEVTIFQNHSPRLALGAKYQKEKYALLCGFGNYNGVFNAGFQIPLKVLDFTMSYSFYSRIGSVVGANLVYKW